MKTILWTITGVICFTILTTPFWLYRFIWLSSCESVTTTIHSKENVVDRSASKYLIFTKDEVFENADSYMVGKFNSSDFYNKLNAGDTKALRVCGWRVPFLSWYRNIIEVKE